MGTPFLAEIRMFGGNFGPKGWALCQGQVLAIAQNQALFSLLGATYGGNGQTTFALPDFRGRTPVGQGTGPGLPQMPLGQMSGNETVTITIDQYPAHTHMVTATSDVSNSVQPTGNVFAAQAGLSGQIYGAPTNLVQMDPQVLTQYAGGNQPHPNMQPYLAVNFIIALQGIYPSRN